MPKGVQVKNGKAFEYSLAYQYYIYLQHENINVEMVDNSALKVARGFYNSFPDNKKEEFDTASKQTIEIMQKIEPGLRAQTKHSDKLFISLQNDSKGATGDVRDVVFRRIKPAWEIGFSAKNNNDAVKHSRLSHVLDFGNEWVGCPCSQTYWDEIKPVFNYLLKRKSEGHTFKSLGDDKIRYVYIPLLKAFRKELIRINNNNVGVPAKLIKYLIGNYSFYKVIKDDSHNLVIVKAFNTDNKLNKTVNGVKTKYTTPKINLPNRIVEFDFMAGRESTTLDLILDGGWEVSFRIHSADSKIVPSLKFDIQLLGNPPILFTQNIFR